MGLSSDDGRSQGLSPAPSTISTSSQDSAIMPKMYYCQRCLNHGWRDGRKGHKPHCRYATCSCKLCEMVERRRQLNNALARIRREFPQRKLVKGEKRIRKPTCARCAAHGLESPLRGHKKKTCPFENCTCKKCKLVGSRRELMARQVKVRRSQVKEQNQENRKPMGRGWKKDTIIEYNDGNQRNQGKIVEEPPANSPPLLAPKPIRPTPQLSFSESMSGISFPTSFASMPPVGAPVILPQPLLMPSPQMVSPPTATSVSLPELFMMLMSMPNETAPQTPPQTPTQLPLSPYIYSYMLGFENPYRSDQC